MSSVLPSVYNRLEQWTYSHNRCIVLTAGVASMSHQGLNLLPRRILPLAPFGRKAQVDYSLVCAGVGGTTRDAGSAGSVGPRIGGVSYRSITNCLRRVITRARFLICSI
jgi:hypothetical protein